MQVALPVNNLYSYRKAKSREILLELAIDSTTKNGSRRKRRYKTSGVSPQNLKGRIVWVREDTVLSS